MKRTVITIAAPVLLTAAALAGELVNVSGASTVALDGYDPVAFFSESKPVNGSPGITAEHRGAIYYFASQEPKAVAPSVSSPGGGRVLGCHGAKNTVSSRPGILWYDVRVSNSAFRKAALLNSVCKPRMLGVTWFFGK